MQIFWKLLCLLPLRLRAWIPPALVLLLAAVPMGAQTAPPPAAPAPGATRHPFARAGVRACAECIRAHEEFLASDAMQGRGSGTRDESVAAAYVAAQLRQYGIRPAGDQGGYIQRAPTVRWQVTEAPRITVEPPPRSGLRSCAWSYGKEFLTTSLSRPKFSGELQTLDADSTALDAIKIASGGVVLVTGSDRERIRQAVRRAVSLGATAALFEAAGYDAGSIAEAGKRLPLLSVRLASEPEEASSARPNLIALTAGSLQTLAKMPAGSKLSFDAPSTREAGHTENAVGILSGSAPPLQHSAVLLSAHLDHLGVGTPVRGDAIYNGADDDASGTAAVLELARLLGKGARPRRTVIFALFGSEEEGGLGAAYFREHPPVPLADLAANLEFEMIGRADKAVKADAVWLTGWERSNLGPALAAHGANLVPDPHPEQGFFARSDNYVLAKKGVVAQTISSFGLHPDYHQPSDDIAHLDFRHMDAAITSLLEPVEWLVNSSFTPRWTQGGRP